MNFQKYERQDVPVFNGTLTLAGMPSGYGSQLNTKRPLIPNRVNHDLNTKSNSPQTKRVKKSKSTTATPENSTKKKSISSGKNE